MASQSQFRNDETTVSFGERLAASHSFQALFREGMGLVEEAAAYLDGDGRSESKTLARVAALAYATESMRLTTRLMQLASWLLLQRAVNEGEMSQAQALSEKHKVKLSRQETAVARDTFEMLPARLRDLVQASLRLQDRILHLDALISGAAARPAEIASVSPVELQRQAVRRAFKAKQA